MLPRLRRRPQQFPPQFPHLPAAVAKAAGEDGDLGWQPGAEGASTDFGRQVRLHPSLTMGAPAGQQPVFGDDRLNFRQFPDLVPFHKRSLRGLRVLQSTAAVRTGLRPVLHAFIDLLGRRQLPVVSLVPFLTTRLFSFRFLGA